MTDPSTTFHGLFGATAPNQIPALGAQAPTPHSWTAGADGLYHTATDLKAEWQGFADQAAAGNASSLLPYQRVEADAAALFQNTKLKTLDTAIQARDREDVQREIDAVAAAMTLANIAGPLTETTYLQLEHTLQANTALEELAVQGHGLNNPPASRYAGYTNDFQNTVDKTTLYVGTGFDHNQNALTAFADDVILTHIPFPTIVINGHVVQLNQNADRESGVAKAVGEANQSLFGPVVTASDFAQHGKALPKGTKPAEDTLTPAAKPNATTTLFGAPLAATITTTAHTWTADATTGLYTTASDLQTEWRDFYTAMLAGHGGALTAEQRMEGNAEAVFENTGLSKLDAATQARDRQDVQRELDAIGAAMQANGITTKVTAASYVAMERTIQGDPTLVELAMQGHGLNNAPLARYAGYTNDIQNAVDAKTRFIGGGLDNGERAIRDFMDDVIMTHAAFPTVYRNGHAIQLNQNGANESSVKAAVHGLNEAAFTRVFKARDFTTA